MKSLKNQFIFLKANCFRNILVISKKNEKTEKNTKVSSPWRQKSPGVFLSFFCLQKKLLKQKRFEKIFQFIENFANFESKHPGIFEIVTLYFN